MTEKEKLQEKIDSFKERIADKDTDPAMVPELKNSLQRTIAKLKALEEKEEAAEKETQSKKQKEAEAEAQKKAAKEADDYEARLKRLKSCTGESLEQIRSDLGKYFAASTERKASTAAVKKPITQVFGQKMKNAFEFVFKKERVEAKLDKIKPQYLETAKKDFVSGLENLKKGFGGIKSDGFIKEFEETIDKLIEDVKKRQETAEE
jgi:DNA repair exonuclease SbcCD ATPase subunit